LWGASSRKTCSHVRQIATQGAIWTEPKASPEGGRTAPRLFWVHRATGARRITTAPIQCRCLGSDSHRARRAIYTKKATHLGGWTGIYFK
jgi:hypothetical protein